MARTKGDGTKKEFVRENRGVCRIVNSGRCFPTPREMAALKRRFLRDLRLGKLSVRNRTRSLSRAWIPIDYGDVYLIYIYENSGLWCGVKPSRQVMGLLGVKVYMYPK